MTADSALPHADAIRILERELDNGREEYNSAVRDVERAREAFVRAVELKKVLRNYRDSIVLAIADLGGVEQSAHIEELLNERDQLAGQIEMLADVLTEEFGGPTGPESACEMAVRVLRSMANDCVRLSENADGLAKEPEAGAARISLKMFRESLCVAQMAIGRCGDVIPDPAGRIARLQELIDLIDLLRPLGPDGKHGDLHTAWCGCQDKPEEAP